MIKKMVYPGLGHRPIVSSIAVVIRDHHFLLVRRSNPPDAGLWGFSGGKIEFGEKAQEAAVRELLEETSIQATAGPIFTAVDAFDVGEEQDIREHHVLVAVLCFWECGVPNAGDDALEARWFKLPEIEKLESSVSLDVVRVASQASSLILNFHALTRD
jgi:8-oxo-dGTP diphosphatase